MQNEEGYWDPAAADAGSSNGLAFALLAHRTRPPKNKPGKHDGKEHDEKEQETATGQAEAERRLRQNSSIDMTGMMAAMMTGGDADDVVGDGLRGAAADGTDQCPVTGFDHSAICSSMPDRLRKAAAEDGSGLPAERIWTTLLAVRMLMSMHECFLLQARSSSAEAGSSFDETVVDRAMAWLQSVADRSEPLAAMIYELMEEAEAQVKVWRSRQASLAARTQASWKKQQSNRDALDAQRVAGSVAMAFRRNHDTFSALLAPATGAVQRWQQFFLVVTALMGMLTVVRLALPPSPLSYVHCASNSAYAPFVVEFFLRGSAARTC